MNSKKSNIKSQSSSRLKEKDYTLELLRRGLASVPKLPSWTKKSFTHLQSRRQPSMFMASGDKLISTAVFQDRGPQNPPFKFKKEILERAPSQSSVSSRPAGHCQAGRWRHLEPATLEITWGCVLCWAWPVSRVLLFAAPWTDCNLPGSSVHGSSPGKNTRMGCHPLLQGIFPIQGSPTLQVGSLASEPPGKPKNAGAGSPSLLQRIFQTQESHQGLLHCRGILYQLSHKGIPRRSHPK